MISSGNSSYEQLDRQKHPRSVTRSSAQHSPPKSLCLSGAPSLPGQRCQGSRSKSPRLGEGRSKPSYEDIDLSPGDQPFKSPTASRHLTSSTDLPSQPAGQKGPVLPPKHFRDESDNYGKLDHGESLTNNEMYGTVFGEDNQMLLVHPEMYNKLNHNMLSSEISEQYGELDHGVGAWGTSQGGSSTNPKSNHYSTTSTTSALTKKTYGGALTPDDLRPKNGMRVDGYESFQGERTRHTVNDSQLTRKLPKKPKAYGQLEPNVKGISKKKSDQYKSKPNSKSSNQEGTRTKFDPYGTLPSSRKTVDDSSLYSEITTEEKDDIIEEEYSTPIYNIDRAPMPVQRAHPPKYESPRDNGSLPPPGYEKFSPLCPTTAQLAAISVVPSELAPPSAPPRTASIKKKIHDEMSSEDKMLLDDSPVSDEVTAFEVGTRIVSNTPQVSKVLEVPPPPPPYEPADGKCMNSLMSENKPVLAPKPRAKPKRKLV